MARIHLLPEVVQNQIAAGEVVERPASIVKELLENSLDAGATSLRITVEQGGQQRIRIQDNGSGMVEEDMLMACTRYATSKLTTLEDLERSIQYGFRGEALASIASVSKVTIKSKPPSATTGQELTIQGGLQGTLVSVGIPEGTIIEVEDIFYNTPARKKFLKTPSTEFSHIHQLIQHYSLLHWDKEFLLVHNGRTILHVRPAAHWQDRVHHLLHPHHQHLMPIYNASEECTIEGFCSTPHYSPSGNHPPTFFVNQRPIRSALLLRAVKEAYHRLLPNGASPIVLVSITIAPHLVDINVHPRKTEVRFEQEQVLFKQLWKTLLHHLESSKQPSPITSAPFTPPSLPTPRSTTPPSLNAGRYASSPYSLRKLPGTTQQAPQLFTAPIASPSQAPFTIIGQLHRSYILIALADGCAIIDQHAAHERILFQRHLAQHQAKEVITQPLLIPSMLQLPLSLQQVLSDSLDALTSIGFTIQDMGGGSFGITHVPGLLPPERVETAFYEILEDHTNHVPLETALTKTQDKLLAYAACKGAVKFGDTLTMQEMEQLITDYFATPLRSTCPHGRPSSKEFDLSMLAQFFKRPF